MKSNKINEGQNVEHSQKWANRNRRPNSFNAGLGDRGSRNQGTGDAGLENTLPSDGIDTTKMSPQEKLQYFKSLGLTSQLGNIDQKPKTTQAGTIDTASTIKKLKSIFKYDTAALSDITDGLRTVKQNDANRFPELIRSVETYLGSINSEKPELHAEEIYDKIMAKIMK